MIMKRQFLLLFVALLLATLSSWAQTSNYFNGFETTVADGDWGSTVIRSSGYNGITSSTGGSYGETGTGDFTRFGGYNYVFPTLGYKTSIDIYLDVNGGYANDKRFDYSSAISDNLNAHRRDFVFTGGFYNDATGPGANTNRFVFSASNNSPGNPKDVARTPIAINTTGWYTFEHYFHNNGSGVLVVDLKIYNSADVLMGSWTLSDPNDIIGTTVGGNRYGWMVTNQLGTLAIDNCSLDVIAPPSPVTTIGTPTSTTCGTFNVPVKVSDFKNVGTISLKLNYNSALAYTGVDLNPAISAAVPNGANPGQFILSYFGSGVNLADNDVLFTLHFTLLPAIPGAANFTWSPIYGECEYAGPGAEPVVYTNIFNDFAWTIPSRPVKNSSTGLEYCTLQAAIDAASPGNTITVTAGTYAENLTINKPLTILGPNAANSGCSTRVAEAIIVPATNSPADWSSQLVLLTANGITIKGLTFDGDNPLLGVVGDYNVSQGIVGWSGQANISIQNNIIKNLSTLGVGLANDAPGTNMTSGNVIDNNKFDNINPTAGFGIGIYTGNNTYVDITNNCMTNVRKGIQGGENNHKANTGNVSPVWSGNTIQSYKIGIWNNLAYSDATPVTISGNSVTTVPGSTINSGIEISSIGGTSSVSVTNNSVTGAMAGINLWNNTTSATVTVGGNTFTDCDYGVFANNFDGYSSNADPSSYIVDGAQIVNPKIAGLYVKDNSSNTNASTVAVQVKGNTTITGTLGTAFLVEGADASLSFNGASPAIVSGTPKYIVLKTNTINVPAGNIDATAVSFDGKAGSAMSNAELFGTEDKIDHKIDYASLGFVTIKANNDYVTVNSFVAPNTTPSIQRGIDAASAGFTVNVQAGNYGIETASNRSVFGVNGPHVFGLFIDKANLTVRGYKSGDVPVALASEAAVLFQTGSTANFGPSGVFVQANGVTLEGLKIGDNVSSSNKTVEVVGEAFTMNKCFINTSSDEGAFYMGRWDATHPITTYSITNNIFNNALVSINNGAGMTGDRTGRLITGNTFTGVATPYLIGFRGWNGANPAQGWILEPVGGAVITGNAFNNTGVDKYIVARGNAGGYDNTQFNWADIWNLNTYGNHVVTLANQPAFNVRSYNDGSYPETRRISPKVQENVTIGQNGDVVLVSDGTYVENVVVTKNISLLSVNGATSSIIDGVNAGSEQGAIELVAGRDGVRIGSIGHGFTVKGIDGPAGSEKAAIYLQGAQSNITIEDNIIEARGDAALQGEWDAANDHITINKNVITGQTFNGAVPATGDQFTVPNVARQAVAFGGGTSTANTGNFVFTNNIISAITGITAVGNGLVTLDLVGVNDISGNTFSGQPGPTAWRPALRVRGSGTYTIKRNSFTGNFNLALERQGTTVNASENWWGDASGPYNAPQNICGLGKAVTANVTFRPWYTNAAMTTLSTTPAGPIVDVVIPITSTVECVASATAPTLPVVKDFCGTVLNPATPVMLDVLNGCIGTRTYTYTYTDALGQQLVWAYTYNIVRTTAPSEFGTPVSITGVTVECASAATAPTILPVVKDVCGVVIPTPTPVISSVSCEGTKTFTYTYVDCAGKQFVWTYSYTIDHTTAPVVPEAGSSTVACASMAIPPLALEASVDQQQTTQSTGANNRMGLNTGVGQSFTPAISGKLTKLDVYVHNFVGTPTFSLVVYQGSGKTGSPIYNSSGYTISSTGWVTLTLPENTAPSLVSGTQYTFWLTAYPYNSVEIGLGDNVYTGGVSWDECTTCTPAYTADHYDAYDCMFKTYMNTATTVTDVCGNVIPTPVPTIGGTYNGCSGTKTYTYKYEDCSGLFSNWVYTYTISAPVVTMPPVQGSTVSCVSAATAPTPPVVLDNCGRTMIVSAGVPSADPACNGTKTWTFTYTDCALATYTWVYTYTITYSGGLTAPTAGASTVAGPAQAVNPGAPANITDACGRTVVPVLVGSSTPPACEGQVVWTYRYTACDNTTTADWTYTYTVTTLTLSGTLKYNNSAQKGMGDIELQLFDAGDSPVSAIVHTATGTGAYSFTGLCPGIYTIKVMDNTNPVGGINSTDAGAVNAWSSTLIQQVKFMAGDVAWVPTGKNFISSTDASRIQQYFVFGTAFDRPAWSYWKVGDMVQNNYNPSPIPTSFSVNLTGNLAGYDLYAMCTGDFNGSLLSSGLKSATSSLMLATNSNMQVGANQEFELPLRAGSKMEVGAVSMVLEIPSGLVNVQNVVVNGSTVPVLWAVKGNELRISWNSSMPINVAENGNLLTLKLKSTNAFTMGQMIEFALKSDPLNELADGNFDVIQSAKLLVAQVANGVTGIINPTSNNSLLLSNYPNPFKGNTTIDYQLPENGKVTIQVYNSLGQLVKSIVDANQDAGNYSIRMDANNLMPGIYIAKLRLTNLKVDMTGTVKLSVLK